MVLATGDGASRTGPRIRHSLLAALTLLGGLAGLIQGSAARAEAAIRAEYRCSGAGAPVDVTALFFPLPPRHMVLIVDKQARRLPQAPSASGARYAEGSQEFWVKGREATWLRGGTADEKSLRCVVRS